MCLSAALAAHHNVLPFRTLAEQLVQTKAQLAGHANLEGMRLTQQKYTVFEIKTRYEVLLRTYAAEQAVCCPQTVSSS